jgi:hypothetical protein
MTIRLCPSAGLKEAATKGGLPARGSVVWSYLSCVEILPKLVFSLVPMPFTAAMIATEMPAAIRPYSMAVAPD